jgi:hypothetical protein
MRYGLPLEVIFVQSRTIESDWNVPQSLMLLKGMRSLDDIMEVR